MFNAPELRAQMVRHEDTISSLAAALGKSYGATLNKLNGKQSFTTSEIKTMIDRYNLSPDDVMTIFFAFAVAQNATQ